MTVPAFRVNPPLKRALVPGPAPQSNVPSPFLMIPAPSFARAVDCACDLHVSVAPLPMSNVRSPPRVSVWLAVTVTVRLAATVTSPTEVLAKPSVESAVKTALSPLFQPVPPTVFADPVLQWIDVQIPPAAPSVRQYWSAAGALASGVAVKMMTANVDFINSRQDDERRIHMT